jgi:hypothetical protein
VRTSLLSVTRSGRYQVPDSLDQRFHRRSSAESMVEKAMILVAAWDTPLRSLVPSVQHAHIPYSPTIIHKYDRVSLAACGNSHDPERIGL